MNKTFLIKSIQSALAAALVLPLGALAQMVASELTLMGITKQSNGQESLAEIGRAHV